MPRRRQSRPEAPDRPRHRGVRRLLVLSSVLGGAFAWRKRMLEGNERALGPR